MVQLRKKKPLSGYTWENVLDAVRDIGSVDEARCELCGKRLRWVHLLTHPACDLPVAVGVCCAERLCNGFDVRGAEATARNRAERRRRFLDPARWHRSANGNLTRKVCRVRVTLFATKWGSWAFCMKERRKETQFPSNFFLTEQGAMDGAFEWLERVGYP